MKLLILGGTVFLGRHLVQAARARGHEVTCFHRGKSNPNLVQDVTTITGDRKEESGLAALDGLEFDAVIDTCGYAPRIVGMSAQKLAGRVGCYCFISTVSVYANWPEAPALEISPLATLADPTREDVTGETYGALKALCEQAVEAVFPGHTLVIRPGLIVGPFDPSDRFTYWPHRVAKGGEVLAPGGPLLPTQWIDVRDLADWTIRLLEAKATGTFNADGPVIPLGNLLSTCLMASRSNAIITYADEAFLQAQGVGSWLELPLWIPGLMGRSDGGATVIDKALAAGLTHRPVLETVLDTLVWDDGRPQENAWKNTLKPEKEAQVLAAWHARPKTVD